MTSRPRYQPVDARDVTSEVAAFQARGVNGRVTPTKTNGTSPATEQMRARLPRPTHIFQTLKSGGSEALAAAVRDQQADEDAQANEKRRRAEDEYEEYLAHRNQRARQPEEDVELPFDDEANEEEGQAQEQEHGAATGTAIVDRAPATHDANFQRLAEEAAKAAEQIIVSAEKIVASAPAPAPAPAVASTLAPAPASTPASDVLMRMVTTLDIDRLWDWLRDDARKPDDHAWMFLGRSFATSIELHNTIGEIANNHEQMAIRAIDVKGTHLGFFMLKPIDRRGNVAMLHVYLAPSIRMSILQLAPYILTGARQIIGPQMNLATHSPREHERFERFFKQFGFRTFVTFIQFGEGQTVPPHVMCERP